MIFLKRWRVRQKAHTIALLGFHATRENLNGRFSNLKRESRGEEQVKRSFFLGVAGGISSFAMGILAIFVMASYQTTGQNTDLTVNIALAFIAGTLGIVGSALGTKHSGTIMIVSAVLALIATSLFGVLPCVLLGVGGALSFKEKEVTVVESGKKKKQDWVYYLGIFAAIATILTLVVAIFDPFIGLMIQPRASLIVSLESYTWMSSDAMSSITFPVKISNYSPQTANILPDWNLTLVFGNSTFRFPNANCTYGTTKLEPAQQTEFVFSYDITHNFSYDMNGLRRTIFTISFIDEQGTQQQQFVFWRPVP